MTQQSKVTGLNCGDLCVGPAMALSAKSRELLQGLTQLNSGSRNPSGVNDVQQLLVERLRRMGFQSQRLMHPQSQHYGDLLVADLNVGAPLRITLVGHADTVLENRDDLRFHFDEASDRVTGPGVADDKGGLTVALMALEDFLSRGQPRVNLRFVSSPSEELGSPGFTSILAELGRQSDCILGFEPALENGNLITSRHGNRWYDIEIKGIEAHSGRANGEELNAAHEMAMKIAEWSQLPLRIPGTKLNVGSLISSHDKFNVVCGRVRAKLDTRFRCRKTRDELHLSILEILSQHRLSNRDGTQVQYDLHIADDCPPLEPMLRPLPALESFLSFVAESEGRPVCAEHGGGASDVNYMWHEGALAIDGLGPVSGNLHTPREYVVGSTLVTRSLGVSALLDDLNQFLPELKSLREEMPHAVHSQSL